jgi:protein-S-isoprenylcysteine O-methyltransferase Ste14
MSSQLFIKTLLFTLLIPGTVIVYLPYQLAFAENRASAPLIFAIPAFSAMLAGVSIYLRCAWDFIVQGLGTPAPIAPPRHLVSIGLYRWTRNPMYNGVLLLLLGECLLSRNPELLLYTSGVGLVFHLSIIFHEEPFLHRQFGTDYAEYCRRVPRWGITRRGALSESADGV